MWGRQWTWCVARLRERGELAGEIIKSGARWGEAGRGEAGRGEAGRVCRCAGRSGQRQGRDKVPVARKVSDGGEAGRSGAGTAGARGGERRGAGAGRGRARRQRRGSTAATLKATITSRYQHCSADYQAAAGDRPLQSVALARHLGPAATLNETFRLGSILAWQSHKWMHRAPLYHISHHFIMHRPAGATHHGPER
ncbi:hypothetical protein E2C01_031425 [Portunus trituberculatus]|uniref:Uncharacterized protein n=1 Tax=Portunus trituberculatus TaxID=210409 RepID=A0A5B7ETE7_PORTR|nr:hypothetical protein [Portunus trituberculatus]